MRPAASACANSAARSPAHGVSCLVEHYAKTQGLFRTDDVAEYSEVVELDISTIEPSLAGPRRPQDRVSLKQAKAQFARALSSMLGESQSGVVATEGHAAAARARRGGALAEAPAATELDHGAVVIAAITSCTNTSNPSVMIGAGLLARNAVARGLRTRSWVKTSLAPGSMVVTDYLEEAGLMPALEQLGFSLVGYGCTTCIGNSGPLPDDVAAAVKERNLVVAAVLSGNRNFEGRIQPLVRANYLASPPLVVAYALAGRMTIDLMSEPLGQDSVGRNVYLRDIWPTESEIQDVQARAVRPNMFGERYGRVFEGDERWRALAIPDGEQYQWNLASTYIRHPPYFENMPLMPPPLADIEQARVLALLGDSITTDHISPAGSIPVDSPAGAYLIAQGVEPVDFNSYGARRGNHEVMVRGTFGNIRLRNHLAPGTEGGWTRYQPDGTQMTIYDAAMRYGTGKVPLIVLAGNEYGSGSSRDWAAKGARLLGVRAVIAESFERIHRSNLVNMGVLPLQFKPGQDLDALKLTGEELYDVRGIAEGLAPRGDVAVRATAADGRSMTFQVTVRIETPEELAAYRHGGILPYVLRQLLA